MAKSKKAKKSSRTRNTKGKGKSTKSKKRRTKKDKDDDDSDDDDDGDGDDDDGDGEEHGKGGKVSLTDIDDWDDTEEGGSFGEVPDNKYEVKIKSATLNHSKSSGRRQVSWDLEIAGGEYKGRHLFKHDGIDDEQQRSFLRGGLAKLGVEWPKKSKFVATLADLEGTFAAVTVRTKGDYQNVYFDKALDEDAVGDLDDGDDGDGDDDAPELEKGDRCVAEIDGEDYAGKITKLKKGKATVKFDDGDTEVFDVDDLRAEDDDSGDGDDDDGDGDDDDGDGEGGGVEVDFSDDDLTKKDKKRIKKLAKKHEIDAEDYETTTDLLIEIAEYCEIEGSYKKAAKLIKECEEYEADDGDGDDD